MNSLTAEADAQPGAGVTNEALQSNIPLRLDRLPWSRWHLRVALALGIAWLLDGLEGGVGGSLSGALKSSTTLHFTDVQLGFISTLYLAGGVGGALIFGYLADAFGRRRLFVWTLMVYVCATSATAFSWNLTSFAVCRLLTGAGIGGEYAAITAAIDELIPARVRGTVDLVINATFWLGVMLGSVVAASFLSDSVFGLRVGWRLAFFFGLPLAGVVLALRRHVPESPRWLLNRGRRDEAERVMEEIEAVVAAESGRLALVVETVSVPKNSGTILQSASRLFFGRYKARAFLCLLLMAAQSFFYNSVFFSSTLLLLRFYGVSAAHAGVLFVPIAMANFLGPALLGRLFDVLGRRVMVAGCFCLTGVIFTASTLLFAKGSLGLVAQIAWWTIAFFFASAAAASAYLTVSEVFPQRVRASAIALFYAAGTAIGGVLGPLVFGALLSRGARAPLVDGFLASAAAMMCAGIAQAVWGVAAERKPLEQIV